MNVEWRPVVGYEGRYEVSDEGSVRSVDRWVTYTGGKLGAKHLHHGRVLKTDERNGYAMVPLSSNSKSQATFVHRLVLEAFVGPRPDGMQACHNDGNRRNNTVANLRWDTASNNVQDCLRHGTQAKARLTHCPQNHPYDEENTIRSPEGHRSCRACRRERDRVRKRRNRLSGGRISLDGIKELEA